MIPQPPGNDSAWRAGKGFQISNTRKSIKPRSKYFQLSGARAATYVNNCPETSSITTNCGSCNLENRAVLLEAQIPMRAMKIAANVSGSIRESTIKLPRNIRGCPISPLKFKKRLRVQFQKCIQVVLTSKVKPTPAKEPQVPGAFGR